MKSPNLPIDRSTPPAIQAIKSVTLPPIETFHLDNGIPVYMIEAGSQPVLKMEVIFHAGRPYEKQQLIARTTARMIKEGTKNYSSQDIAEKTDFIGAGISIPVNLDTSNFVFHCLSRHFEEILPVWTEMLVCPTFPEKALQRYIQRNHQRLKVDLAKTDVISYRHITEAIFGKTHPYGYNSVEETFTNLNSEACRVHFEKHYVAENCKIFISGRPATNIQEILNKFLGKMIPSKELSQANLPKTSFKPKSTHIAVPNASQTSIRIGRKLFNRSHPDYPGFFVLNTILGGFFGSRLMDNLREDKGYTYNIFSTVDAMIFEGAFLIGCEVANEHKDAAVKEIFHELTVLQNEEVAADELTMVRNFLMGSLLSMADGPFNIAEIVRTGVLEDLPNDYFQSLIQFIQNVQPAQIKELAQRHLKPKDLWTITVGP